MAETLEQLVAARKEAMRVAYEPRRLEFIAEQQARIDLVLIREEQAALRLVVGVNDVTFQYEGKTYSLAPDLHAEEYWSIKLSTQTGNTTLRSGIEPSKLFDRIIDVLATR